MNYVGFSVKRQDVRAAGGGAKISLSGRPKQIALEWVIQKLKTKQSASKQAVGLYSQKAWALA
jgi:hypothetical protein